LVVGLNLSLIDKVDVMTDLESFTDGEIKMEFSFQNPLPIDLTILFLQSTISDPDQGYVLALVEHAFKPGLVVPIQSMTDSGTIKNVSGMGFAQSLKHFKVYNGFVESNMTIM
jgi:hypothetical protein